MTSAGRAMGRDVVVGSLGQLAAVLLAQMRVFAPLRRGGGFVVAQADRADDVVEGSAAVAATAGPCLDNGGLSGWKPLLFPPRRRLWSATRTDDGFTVGEAGDAWPPTAFFAVRPCEIAAMRVQDKVFAEGPWHDPVYAARRRDTLIVALQCARAAPTCFCASMETGPRATDGFDLALTDLEDGFLVEVGTERGAAIARQLESRPACEADRAAALELSARVAAAQTRRLPAGVEDALAAAPEHPHWDDVAARCLSCGACALSCPTCFCSDTEDVTDPAGVHAERWRVWASCFDLDFTLVGGGPVRRSIRSRYRQWLTHKLSSWVDQFGVSGCVGCGQCIVACPVGIDLTQEAAAIAGEAGREDA